MTPKHVTIKGFHRGSEQVIDRRTAPVFCRILCNPSHDKLAASLELELPATRRDENGTGTHNRPVLCFDDFERTHFIKPTGQ